MTEPAATSPEPRDPHAQQDESVLTPAERDARGVSEDERVANAERLLRERGVRPMRPAESLEELRAKAEYEASLEAAQES